MRTTAAALAGALLVILGTGVAACRGDGPTGRPDGPLPFLPVATVGQIMDGLVVPSSEALFDAVVYENGVALTSPKTDGDWYTLRMHALAVAEAGNLLLIPPRAKDAGDWLAMSRAMTEKAADAASAAESKSIDRLLAAGGQLYGTCTACHKKYMPAE